MNLEFYFWLLFAHFLGDFAFQPAWMAKMKKVDPWTLVGHSVIAAGVVSFFLSRFGLFSLWKAGWLFITHLILDYIKDIYGDFVPVFVKNSIDQLGHIICILIIVFI